MVVKPDQLIKRRGKLGLLKVNTDWEGVKAWLAEKRGQEIEVFISIFIQKSQKNIAVALDG